MHMHRHHVNIGKSAVEHVLLGEFPRRTAAIFRIHRGHEGQFHRLSFREPTRRVSRQRPTTIDHAVADLIIKGGWRPAELHCRVEFHIDAPAGLLFNLRGPWLHEEARDRPHRRQKMLAAQGHFCLRIGGTSLTCCANSQGNKANCRRFQRDVHHNPP